MKFCFTVVWKIYAVRWFYSGKPRDSLALFILLLFCFTDEKEENPETEDHIRETHFVLPSEFQQPDLWGWATSPPDFSLWGTQTLGFVLRELKPMAVEDLSRFWPLVKQQQSESSEHPLWRTSDREILEYIQQVTLVPSTVLGSGNAAVDKTHKNPCCPGVYNLPGETDNP